MRFQVLKTLLTGLKGPSMQIRHVKKCEKPVKTCPQKPKVAKSLLAEHLPRPYLVRIWGPNLKNTLAALAPGLATYSFAMLLLTIYLTDWRVIVTAIPFYSGKFDNEKKDKK